jgi:hypothetical protein
MIPRVFCTYLYYMLYEWNVSPVIANENPKAILRCWLGSESNGGAGRAKSQGVLEAWFPQRFISGSFLRFGFTSGSASKFKSPLVLFLFQQ